ncbi:MAG: RHS repeat-associated core domain-containing protein [Betaproteobacteria bacterium]
MPRLSLPRSLGWVLVLGLGLVAAHAHAGTTTISVGLDTDSNTATGCVVSTANGPVSGIDLVISTVVTTSVNGATVTRLERQICAAGVLGAPIVYDNGGWNVGLGNGTGGNAVVESSLPLALLPPAGTMKAVAIANDGAGGQDATATFAIILSPAGGPTGPTPVPLAPWLVLPLAVLLLAATLWLRRRYPHQTRLLFLLVVFTASGLVWAATVIRDGNIGDWNGVAPAVTDAAGDAPVNADLVAVFYQQDATNLYLRVDADIRKDAPGNQPPVVNAGANQTITLPSGASLPGSATDDGLPNPPGQLTYSWTKFSGPGTVTFGNATMAATTATFSAPGSYVLRLTASDGALPESADVTITVNAGGGANQVPTVNAGSDQTITLPAAATLAGAASDDGLPNPPGSLTTTWSFVSGPISGVVFGDPAAPGTSATFAAPGTYVLRLTANDGALTASGTVQIDVIDGGPQLAAIPDRTIELGGRFQQLLEGRDGNGNDILAYALNMSPAGASLNPAPLIDWVPTAAQLGPHPFTARVTDSSGKFATTTFNVTVVHTNHAPALQPQNNQIVAIGTTFTRKLAATDPDAGDTLTFSLMSGPSGMTISGADLSWPTTGKSPGDYAVTVKVTDNGGLSDQKSFTVTLQQSAPPPVAKDDSYSVKVAQTLTVPPPGVLGNDFYGGAGTLAATRLTDPGVGTVTAFDGDGGFTYQAPATPPGVPLTMAKMWNTSSGGSDRYHELVADLNGDGKPDVISFDNNGGVRARSGLDGTQLWSADRTGATDCRLNSGGGSMDHRVLADLDDSGHAALAFTTTCTREGSTWGDSIVAFDHLGKVKWVSPPLSKPHPDIRRGVTPVPPGGFTPGGLAWRRGLSVARLTAGGAPVLLMRVEIPLNDGYMLYYDTASQFHYAGCRAVTGLVADENVACRATLIINGADGSVLQTLVDRNPAARPHSGGPGALSEMPPIAMDIDGDGRVDLVSGTEVWMQNAGGGFDLAWHLNKSVNDTAVADLDGDGKAEIVHLRSSGESNFDDRGIFIYSHDGQLKRRIPLWTYWFTPLTIADVDGDGRSDIVLGADGTVYAFRDDGRPIWAYKVPQDIPSDPILAPFYTQPTPGFGLSNAAPQVYDLDGDGVAEVVVAANSRVIVLDGRTGLRKLAPYWTFNWSYNDVSALILADMNNDGHVDIVQNAGFNFNCLNPGVAPACAGLVGPVALSGGGSNNWLPGPKAFPNIQYRSTAIDDNARVLHDTTVSRLFRSPAQQGSIRDPRLAQGTSFTYEASGDPGTSAPATVFIEILPDNRPPVFTSTPPKSLLQAFAPTPPGGLVTHYYDLAAFDPDPGDTVTFSLKSGPSWVTMSGPARIRFEPTCGSYGYPCPWGQTTVIVTATDSRGASTDQIFIVNLTTTGVTVPNVVGMLFQPAQAALVASNLQGLLWVEEFSAQPAGTVLAQEAVAGAVVGQFDDIRLTVSKGLEPMVMPFVVGQPLAVAIGILTGAGLQVNVSTVFSTTIPASEVMTQSPAAGTELSPATAPPVDLTVSAGGPLPAPVASIVLEPGPGPLQRLAGDEFQFKAIAILTDGTSADVSLTAAWSTTNAAAATVSTTGFAKAKANGTATIAALLSGKTGQVTLNVASLVPGDTTPPVAAITAPADGATVTGPVDVVGTASDANFLRYELAYSPAGDDTWTLLAEGTSAVTNGVLGKFDPTVLLNDQYTLRLTVFDKNENESVATSTVQAKGDRKVGLFSLTYLDLNLPAAGIPLTINRTYDSRDKALGDFGIGWRLGLKTLRIRTNRVLGTGWVRVVSGPTVSLLATSEHKVSITLPDGRVEEFDMQVSPTSNLGSLDFTTITGYPARPGTLGQLQALTNNSVLIANGGAEDELLDDNTLDTYSPKLYRYTAADGTQIEISPTEGVKKVTDRSGNAVTFGPGGILHSDGRGITFTRDVKGRIVAIADLAGNVQTYAYDGQGDLVKHTSPTGGVSTFAYNGSHGLIEIRDANGNQAVRNEYDAAGRLIAVIDANGKRVEFSHNDAAQEDVITDRQGGVLRVQYDGQGNVLGMEQGVTIEGTLVNAVTTRTFDGVGNQTSLVDPDGKRLSATYSGVLTTASVVDPGGLNLTQTFTYNTRSDPATAVDAGGRSYTFDYDLVGNLIGFEIPDAGTGTAVINAQGMPLQTSDAIGTTKNLTRDAAGNVTREEIRDVSNTLLRRIDFTYDANGNKASETLYRTIGGVSTPLTTQFGYDAANRLVNVTNPLGGVTRREYDGVGRLTAEIDALGRRTTYTYDSLGRRTRATYPDGTFESAGYDFNDNLVTQTDRAGRVTMFTFDELNRNVATTLPNGDTMRMIYSAAGRVAATVDAKGNRTDYAYDPAGRSIGTTFPAVQNGVGGPLVRPRLSKTLNALGAPASLTDPNGRTTTMLYNVAGRLVQTNLPDGSNVKQTFDVLGRRTSVTNEEGQATTFTYDGLGRLVSVSGLAGNATYGYDEASNLVTQTDALGRITRYRYDVLNRLVENEYPGGEIEKSVYDAVGNPVALTRPDGKMITFTYDALNRVTRKALPAGVNVDYTYNGDGQRASARDARGLTTYAYDNIGRLASVKHPGGEVVSLTRDPNGNLTSLASPTATISYDYDALNRLVQVTAPEGQTQAFYDLAGNRVRNTLANGMTADATFDTRNRMTQLAHKTPANTVLQSFATDYSPVGRRTQVTEQDGSITSFGYDAKGRIASEIRTGASPFSISHVYDAVGNRSQLTRAGVPVTFSYDNNDRLLSDGTTTYAYDTNGNLVTRTRGANVTQYGHDAENRLVALQGGGAANQYTYDADGQRVMISTPADVTRFLPDGANNSRLSQVLEERDGAGNLRARFSYGNELLAMARGGTSSFYLRDSLGNVRGLADTTASLTDRYVYDAYGNTMATTGSTANPYRYSGERFDAQDGLYQLRARYYDPAMGRFFTRDPFAGRTDAPTSLHRYLYAKADPVNFADPTGEEPSLIGLTLTQALSSFVDSSIALKDIQQLCNAKGIADQIQSLVATSQQMVALGGLFTVGTLAFTAAAGQVGGTGGGVNFSYVSEDFSTESIIKNFQLQLKGSGNQLGLGFALNGHNNTGLKASVFLLPPPMNVNVAAAGKKAIAKEFKYCGLVPFGKIGVASELSAGGGVDTNRGGYVGVKWDNTIEASLFRGSLSVSWPILTASTKNYTGTLSFFGVWTRSYTAIGATPY